MSFFHTLCLFSAGNSPVSSLFFTFSLRLFLPGMCPCAVASFSHFLCASLRDVSCAGGFYCFLCASFYGSFSRKWFFLHTFFVDRARSRRARARGSLRQWAQVPRSRRQSLLRLQRSHRGDNLSEGKLFYGRGITPSKMFSPFGNPPFRAACEWDRRRGLTHVATPSAELDAKCVVSNEV